MKYQYNKLNDWHCEPIENPIGYLVYTHLLVEHAIDYIIFRKCEKPNKIKNKNFATKAEILYEMELLPEWLYYNISKMNKFRNRLVHDLEVNYENIDLELRSLSGYSVPLNDFIKNESKDLITAIINIIGQHVITPINTMILVEYLSKPEK